MEKNTKSFVESQRGKVYDWHELLRHGAAKVVELTAEIMKRDE